MKTIAQQLNIKDFPFEIKDKNGNKIYHEDSNGYWEKREYDSEERVIYYEDSTGYWYKSEYDSDGNEVYYENSRGAWTKREYDSKGRIIYYEDSDGIIDSRPSENIQRIREFFRQVRLMTHHHLGLGAIKLTVEQQDEICYLVESLINKAKDQ